MQNLIKFILRNSNFLFFIVLEVVAFFLIVNNHEYPKSKVLATTNNIVAEYYSVVSHVSEYFHLRNENDILSAENAQLRNQLLLYQNLQEDSCERTLYKYAHLQLQYIPAKVVNLTTDCQHNYITLNKGARDGVKKGAGVCSEKGVVGVICTVGENFSLVVPLIHIESSISCRIKKNDYIGTTIWNGTNCRFVQLDDIAAHVDVEKGDTVVTSGLTPIFPEGIPVGIVHSARLREGDSYYSITMRLETNFRKLKYVHIINNATKEEQEALENGRN